MFERDASLALSDARFLTEGTDMDTLMFHHPQYVRHYLSHSILVVGPHYLSPLLDLLPSYPSLAV